MAASISDLAQHPLRFDGRLVVVRARLAMGWEGDNFLLDPSAPLNGSLASLSPESVWLYCKPGHECQPDRTVEGGHWVVAGTFVGYFHFVPDHKSRRGDVFDPGPFQLEGIGVFDVATKSSIGRRSAFYRQGRTGRQGVAEIARDRRDRTEMQNQFQRGGRYGKKVAEACESRTHQSQRS